MDKKRLTPEISFEDWLKELIKVTATEIGEAGDVIKINTDAAKQWYDDGFTPYQCFRETFNNENDID